MLISKKYNNIIYFKFKNINDNDFNNYIKIFDKAYLNKNNFKVLFDLSEISIYDTVYSREQLNYMIKNKENTEKYLDKTAIYIKNNIIVNLLNVLIFSIQKPTKPNLITSDLNEAIKFIQ